MSNDDEPSCITEYTDGYFWRYVHTPDEPDDTLTTATMLAGEVAADQACKDGKTYVVASTPVPLVAVYFLPCLHPMLSRAAMKVMYQTTPEGKCVRLPKPTRQ